MMEVAQSPIIRDHYAAIAEGAALVGSIQTMNMATVGGNLCNAAPSADIAPPLLAFDAEAVILGPSGRRSLPLEEFFFGPGKTALAPDELLAEVRVPVTPAGTGSAYARHTPRKQMDIAVVGVAAALTLSGDRIERARVALGAVAPTPVRARQAEAVLEGQTLSDEVVARAADAATNECSPISDVRGSAEFRRHIVRVMTERMLQQATERARSM
jgi:carbon-monoxide dehydrogenase medium subunit